MTSAKYEARWQRREKKLQKKKLAMRVSGRSVFTLQEIARRKAAEAKADQGHAGKKKTHP